MFREINKWRVLLCFVLCNCNNFSWKECKIRFWLHIFETRSFATKRNIKIVDLRKIHLKISKPTFVLGALRPHWRMKSGKGFVDLKKPSITHWVSKLPDTSSPCRRSSTGVIFINVLQAAFTSTDPKSAKKTDNLTVFLGFRDLRV